MRGGRELEMKMESGPKVSSKRVSPPRGSKGLMSSVWVSVWVSVGYVYVPVYVERGDWDWVW